MGKFSRLKKTFLIAGLFVVSTVQATSIEESYVNSVNAVIGLTADDYIGAGSYTLPDQAEMDIYHLPLTNHFDPFYEDINVYINGAVGYSEIEQISPFGVLQMRMKLFKLGGGVRYQPTPQWRISLGVSLIYTELRNTMDYESNDIQRSFYEQGIDSLVNTKQTNWTREYTFQTRYEDEIEGFIPYFDGEYELYKTESTLQLDSVVKVDSVMELAHIKIGSFTPVLGTFKQRSIRLEGKYGYTWMFGDFRDALSSDYYQTYSAFMHFNAISQEDWLKNIYFISEWTEGKGFDGYNAGVGMEFNF